MSDLFNADYSYVQLLNLSASRDDDNVTSDDVLLPAARLTDGLPGAGGTMLVVAGLFDRYVAPVVVIAGLLSNLVALFVFSERSMQRRSSSVYLAAISVVGVAFLSCVMLSWTARTSIDVYRLDGACRTLTYVTHASIRIRTTSAGTSVRETTCLVPRPRRDIVRDNSHRPTRRSSTVQLSRLGRCELAVTQRTSQSVTHVSSFLGVWYVVAFTVERFLVVQYPLRRRSLCTAVKARRAVVGLAAFAGAAHGYGAWTTGVTRPWPGSGPICAPLRRYAGLLSAVHVVDTVLTLLLPFVVISLLNVRIVVAVLRQNRARQAMATDVAPAIRGYSLDGRRRGGQRPALRRHVRQLVAGRRSRHDHFRVTRLLVTVSLSFLGLNLPRHAARLYALVGGSSPTLTLLACERLFNVVYYAHFAVNIILYATLGGSKFRAALRRRCRAVCRCAAAAAADDAH